METVLPKFGGLRQPLSPLVQHLLPSDAVCMLGHRKRVEHTQLLVESDMRVAVAMALRSES